MKIKEGKKIDRWLDVAWELKKQNNGKCRWGWYQLIIPH